MFICIVKLSMMLVMMSLYRLVLCMNFIVYVSVLVMSVISVVCIVWLVFVRCFVIGVEVVLIVLISVNRLIVDCDNL